MALTLKIMSWNLENYGKSKFQKYPKGDLIARTIVENEIDICSFLEIQQNGVGGILVDICTHLNNLTAPNEWGWNWELVDSAEVVAWVWKKDHSDFEPMYGFGINPRFSSGKVIQGGFHDPSGFPKTNSTWRANALNFNGRTPGFMVFQGKPGNQLFAVFNYHTPFATNTQIQALGIKKYSEFVEQFKDDSKLIGIDLEKGFEDALACIIRNAREMGLLRGKNQKFMEFLKASMSEIKRVTEGVLESGTDIGNWKALLGVALQRVTGAYFDSFFSRTSFSKIDLFLKQVLLATTIGGMWTLANYVLLEKGGQPVDKGDIGRAGRQFADAISWQGPPTKDGARVNVLKLLTQRLKLFNFPFKGTMPTLGSQKIDAFLVAGDFNIPFPDATDYSGIAGAVNKLGAGKNGYSKMLDQSGNVAALNNQPSTVIGYSAFKNHRKYILKDNYSAQWTDPNAANYVPIDLSSLKDVEFWGSEDWTTELTNLLKGEGASQSEIDNVYGDRIYEAFDSSTVISNTELFRANAYDNIFVRGGQVQSSKVVDVISALGAWQANDPHWNASLGYLNALGKSNLEKAYGPNVLSEDFENSGVVFELPVGLPNAEAAAFYYRNYVSDHLPIAAEISIG